MDLDYEEIFREFVDDRYVDVLEEEGLELAGRYSERGGSPAVCVALGLTVSGGWDIDEINEELATRRSIYNARKRLGLEVGKPRGRHVSGSEDI